MRPKEIPDELIDQLLAGCEGPEAITGPDGLLKQLTKRVVERADELADNAQRNRIEPCEGLVVHHEHRIQRDRARQCDAARHSSRELRWHQSRSAAQAHRMQFHQHEVTDELFG